MSYEKIRTALEAFHSVSKMDISLTDTEYKAICESINDENHYCAVIHKSKKCLECCVRSDIEAFKTVEKSKEPLRYVCPFGLHEVIVPIFRNGEINGYLFSGPCAQYGSEQDDILLSSALKVAPELDKTVLINSVKALPRMGKAEFESLCDIINLFSTHPNFTSLDMQRDMTLGQHIKAYIGANLSRKLTLAEMSKALHLSTVTLTEHFKREFGLTIVQYITKKRMELARKLLKETSLSVGEISGECGFADFEYFSRTFKRFYGTPPSEWRKNLK